MENGILKAGKSKFVLGCHELKEIPAESGRESQPILSICKWFSEFGFFYERKDPDKDQLVTLR